MCDERKSYSTSEQSLENQQYGSKKELISSSTNCKPLAKHNPFHGFFYTLIASIFITLMSVFVKKLTYINEGYLSFLRNTSLFAGCLPIALYNVREVTGPKKQRRLLMITGFLGGSALYLNLIAFRYLPLGVAAVVMSTMPVVTTLFACIFLKEACGLVQGAVIALTIVGVLLSVRLPELLSNKGETHFDYTYIGGLASAVCSALFFSINFVTQRKMRDLHFSIPQLYVGIFGMVENAIIFSVTSSFVYTQCGLDQFMIMLIGIFGFAGCCTMVIAIQKEAAGIVSVLKASFDIVIAMIFQIIFFDESLDIYNISGACLVIISVGILGIRHWLHTLPEESKIRKRLKWFLL